MAEHNISKFTSKPGRLVMLLREWNEQHHMLYVNKRAALAHWREHRANRADAGEVDPQWPKWSGGCLRKEYLLDLEKVCNSWYSYSTARQGLKVCLPMSGKHAWLTWSSMEYAGLLVWA